MEMRQNHKCKERRLSKTERFLNILHKKKQWCCTLNIRGYSKRVLCHLPWRAVAGAASVPVALAVRSSAQPPEPSQAPVHAPPGSPVPTNTQALPRQKIPPRLSHALIASFKQIG